MSGRLREGVKAAWREGRSRLRRVVVHALLGLRALWHLIRASLSFALQVVAALILLFEEWGWRPLVEALAYLARFAPWARVEQMIARLPPYGALVVLALPTSVLFPLKFLALYLLAAGQVLAAGMLFVGAKIASTALIARIFLLTRPALMQIGWFAAIYNVIIPWKEALFASIRASWPWRYGRMVKTRVRLEAKRAWARWRPVIEETASRFRLAVGRLIGRA
ncbi:hypothetical protein [Hyphomicrobium sp.]|uniref:hypothetical protein n=1 Tax=Hyphomicrobium sp. TaxID=82 RepID=UPI0025B9D9B7|nr:hypothetical protein [Hyphomicrobium sp.]MCC7252465.1 hypothetical protein [Hyphomicrobium sp.]